MSATEASRAAGHAPSDRPARSPLGAPTRWLAERRSQILVSIAATAIALGFLLQLVGAQSAGHTVWRGAVALLVAEVVS